jgi:hypothetical protein
MVCQSHSGLLHSIHRQFVTSVSRWCVSPILGCCTAYISSLLPEFQDGVSVPFWDVAQHTLVVLLPSVSRCVWSHFKGSRQSACFSLLHSCTKSIKLSHSFGGSESCLFPLTLYILWFTFITSIMHYLCIQCTNNEYTDITDVTVTNIPVLLCLVIDIFIAWVSGLKQRDNYRDC